MNSNNFDTLLRELDLTREQLRMINDRQRGQVENYAKLIGLPAEKVFAKLHQAESKPPPDQWWRNLRVAITCKILKLTIRVTPSGAFKVRLCAFIWSEIDHL